MVSGSTSGTTPSQAPSPPKRYISTHDAEGKSIFSEAFPDELATYQIPGMTYYEAYKTFEAPIPLAQETDLKTMQAHAAEDGTITFPKPGATTLRYCDWPPGGEAPLHRHESIDFGIVILGEIEAFMDSGERRLLKPGDCLVQRNTLHGWRNPSTTEYARVVFVIQGTQPVTVNGETMRQDLGRFA
ncbi:hypothetical protein GQ53DRAFT_742493 [Thozetella sp. PMI_491]|nr:hypothetical protein GQ53DRAFT_742493 [Thozetella sp. PMI_491]